MAYSIRPATYADLPAIIRLYLVDFWDEQLMDLLHPFRNKHPTDFERFIRDMLTERWWTLGLEQCVEVLLTDRERVVGFAWWRRSWGDEEKRRDTEGWFTLRRWLSPITIFFIQLRTRLWPYRCADPTMAGAEKRALPAILPLLRDPPSRQKAWHLLTLAVDPAFQKMGLGTRLVQHGLSRGDKEDLTAWLISREGLEEWYGRFGFVQKGRANIGELTKWNGGAVMFRESE